MTFLTAGDPNCPIPYYILSCHLPFPTWRGGALSNYDPASGCSRPWRGLRSVTEGTSECEHPRIADINATMHPGGVPLRLLSIFIEKILYHFDSHFVKFLTAGDPISPIPYYNSSYHLPFRTLQRQANAPKHHAPFGEISIAANAHWRGSILVTVISWSKSLLLWLGHPLGVHASRRALLSGGALGAYPRLQSGDASSVMLVLLWMGHTLRGACWSQSIAIRGCAHGAYPRLQSGDASSVMLVLLWMGHTLQGACWSQSIATRGCASRTLGYRAVTPPGSETP